MRVSIDVSRVQRAGAHGKRIGEPSRVVFGYRFVTTNMFCFPKGPYKEGTFDTGNSLCATAWTRVLSGVSDNASEECSGSQELLHGFQIGLPAEVDAGYSR